MPSPSLTLKVSQIGSSETMVVKRRAAGAAGSAHDQIADADLMASHAAGLGRSRACNRD